MSLVLTHSTPKNTPATAPVTSSLRIHPCFVKRVDVLFPPGPSGLLHAWVNYLDGKLWPYNPDGDFIGNAVTHTFHPNIYLDQEPLILTLFTYNLDDTYPHSVFVYLDVEFIGELRDPAVLLSNFLQVGPTQEA